jgi:hypothetical protein
VRYLAFLLALPVFAGMSLAQTTIPPSQLRLGAPGEVDKLKLFAVGLSGMVQVQIGPGLRLEETPGGIRLTLTSMRLRSAALARAADGTYATPLERVITRNGLIQAIGVDYEHDGARVVPRTPWTADDAVSAIWLEDSPP